MRAMTDYNPRAPFFSRCVFFLPEMSTGDISS
jgi:hypothetical protein